MQRLNYLLDNGQDPWFCIVVSVSSNAEIYFLVEGVSSVSCHQPEEGILQSLRDRLGGEACGNGLRHVAGDTLQSQ